MDDRPGIPLHVLANAVERLHGGFMSGNAVRTITFQVGRTATRLHLDGIPDPVIWRRDDPPTT